MTITYPRDLPTPFAIRQTKFQPLYQQVTAPALGGLMQAADIGPQLWDISYATRILKETEGAAWEAWLDSMQGAIRTFKAWHPLRRYALSYPAGYGSLTRHGGGAFDGTATVVSVAETLDAITIDTLPDGFKLLAGDMLSYAAGGVQVLHRILEDATASGLGVVTVSVSPIAKPTPAEDTVVTFDKPWCKAVLDPKSVAIKWDLGRIAQVSFNAMQVLL
jgi:hypothetical protein